MEKKAKAAVPFTLLLPKARHIVGAMWSGKKKAVWWLWGMRESKRLQTVMDPVCLSNINPTGERLFLFPRQRVREKDRRVLESSCFNETGMLVTLVCLSLQSAVLATGSCHGRLIHGRMRCITSRTMSNTQGKGKQTAGSYSRRRTRTKPTFAWTQLGHACIASSLISISSLDASKTGPRGKSNQKGPPQY